MQKAQQSPDDILNSEKYFYCKTLRGRWSKQQCVEWQKEALRPTEVGEPTSPRRMSCVGCRQGLKIAEELNKTIKAPFVNKNKATGVDEKKADRICKRHDCTHKGKPQPITNFSKNKNNKDGFDRYCKDCKSRLQKDYRAVLKAKLNRAEATIDKSAFSTNNKNTSKVNMTININFSEYPTIYNHLKQMAIDEVRQLDEQIIFLLKHSINFKEKRNV